MAELSKKLESKKYVKSSEDQFDARKLLMSPVQTIDDAHSGRSKTSKKSVTGSSKTESYPLTETTQTNTRVISLETINNEVYEFDVDLLNSWDQSSGTLSYDDYSPTLVDTFNNAKMLSHNKDIICHAKLNQRLLRDSMPSQKILTAKSLSMLNKVMRQDRMQGHLFKRIVVPCKQDGNTERYELISKICDDTISEYMTTTNHDNKLLEINLECGGDIPPRIKINGIRIKQPLKYDANNEDYCCDTSQEMFKTKHKFQHLSTCSPALPYPSANTFGRCSIEDYVKLLKDRWKKQGQQ